MARRHDFITCKRCGMDQHLCDCEPHPASPAPVAELDVAALIDRQRTLDEQRRVMAEEIVQAQRIETAEECRRFASNWIQTAMQHAANESYWREQTEDLRAQLAAAQAHHEEHHERERTWKPPCVYCDSQPHDPSPCPCSHAPCVHDLNRARADLSAAQGREARLREALERACAYDELSHDAMREIASAALASADAPAASHGAVTLTERDIVVGIAKWLRTAGYPDSSRNDLAERILMGDWRGCAKSAAGKGEP